MLTPRVLLEVAPRMRDLHVRIGVLPATRQGDNVINMEIKRVDVAAADPTDTVIALQHDQRLDVLNERPALTHATSATIARVSLAVLFVRPPMVRLRALRMRFRPRSRSRYGARAPLLVAQPHTRSRGLSALRRGSLWYPPRSTLATLLFPSAF